jgi:hypothetical protein
MEWRLKGNLPMLFDLNMFELSEGLNYKGEILRKQ